MKVKDARVVTSENIFCCAIGPNDILIQIKDSDYHWIKAEDIIAAAICTLNAIISDLVECYTEVGKEIEKIKRKLEREKDPNCIKYYKELLEETKQQRKKIEEIHQSAILALDHLSRIYDFYKSDR